MTATATHDTKRGEDARARLSVLSEMPDDWVRALDLWDEVAAPHLGESEGEPVPDSNDQYMILQSLLGAWPLKLLAEDDPSELESFVPRAKAWAEKAMREAKRYTSWVNTDEDYERAVAAFLDGLLAPGSALFTTFRPLAAKLAACGAFNGLSRTILKCTLPGVPDIYQGTEFWDFSFVDPDNRRPIDYAVRALMLATTAKPADLLKGWQSGAIKQLLLARLLADRTESPDLYANGSYTPLMAEGPRGENILAFTRSEGAEMLAVIVPRLAAGLADESGALPGEVWQDTNIALPPGRWRDVLNGPWIDIAPGVTPVGEVLKLLPFAVLRKVAG
jgi:(1->4)-alpha-D-glucan 1-alpha-D-glucosylmutase